MKPLNNNTIAPNFGVNKAARFDLTVACGA